VFKLTTLPILIRTNVQSHQHQSLVIGAVHWCRCAWQVMHSFEQVYSAVHRLCNYRPST